ncbi:unnamed protein product [Pleuronectes platessa]|uniref:Uncharacterized protein n=1 Tax=Pleuronectes platessa TaxID=8262 RepID=A0A9N7YV34_PLEPL|nr:unnamed protein product [Pleuronectes platessa]
MRQGAGVEVMKLMVPELQENLCPQLQLVNRLSHSLNVSQYLTAPKLQNKPSPSPRLCLLLLFSSTPASGWLCPLVGCALYYVHTGAKMETLSETSLRMLI